MDLWVKHLEQVGSVRRRASRALANSPLLSVSVDWAVSWANSAMAFGGIRRTTRRPMVATGIENPWSSRKLSRVNPQDRVQA
jgi:hypothetical protein